MVRHENMSVDEVTPMAKTKTTTKSSSPKAAPKAAAKAAPKKAAAPAAKAAPKKAAAPKAAAPAAPAPKAAAPKKAAPKKPAAAIKLSDPQANLLKEIGAASEAGLTATKKIQRQIDALQTRKLIKKGKKDGEFFKYHVTKLGEKHLASTSGSASGASA